MSNKEINSLIAVIFKSNSQTIYGSEANVNRSEVSANLTLSEQNESKGSRRVKWVVFPAACSGVVH